MSERVDVAIVGGGPAGLSAATALVNAGAGHVVVLEREVQAGGIPRHSDHTGYGVRDLRRVLRGPAYAQRLVDMAREAGVEIRTTCMATGWVGDHALEVTSPQRRGQIEARAVVLATGARERPRAARLVAGDRPDGVYTTGQLQNLVHLQHRKVGSRAVVVGAELVSWSAVLTLREAGCEVALMTTEYERAETYGALALGARSLLRVPLTTRTRVVRIVGRDRVSAVEMVDLDTGQRREVACDTVVFTGDWIPDYELARSAKLERDSHHGGPLVDTALRTSRPGVFAVGNLCHPVDTADVAAIDGTTAARSVLEWLRDEPISPEGVRIRVEPPLRWVAPAIVRPRDASPPRDRLLMWSDAAIALPRVTVRQGDRVIASRHLPWSLSPGRMFRVPWSMLADVDRRGDDVVVSVN